MRNVVKLLLLDAFVTLDTFSAVVSLPQCPAMHWHRDVTDPFRRWAAPGVEAPTPAPGLVAVIPLVNVSAERNGPTEFLMGSHVVSDGRWDTGDDGRPTDPSVAPLHLSLNAAAGSAVYFDLRLRHRGGPNPSAEPRPIMYLGFTLSWFSDNSNFKRPQTAEWADEPSATVKRHSSHPDPPRAAYLVVLLASPCARGAMAMAADPQQCLVPARLPRALIACLIAHLPPCLQRRAMIARLDSAAYTRRLEHELESRGVDIRSIKADARDADAMRDLHL